MNKKAIALIIGGLIILAAIVYFIFFYDFSGGNNVTPPADQTTAEPVISRSAPTPTSTATPRTEQEKSREAANQLAIYFSERYGSSSNQSDFSNLIDLGVFMTDALKAKTDAFVAAERAKTSENNAYQGIITKAIVVEFTTFNESAGTAEALVKTKRQETAIDGKVSSFDQNLSLSLKKVGTEWKVDAADWKK